MPINRDTASAEVAERLMLEVQIAEALGDLALGHVRIAVRAALIEQGWTPARATRTVEALDPAARGLLKDVYGPTLLAAARGPASEPPGGQ